MVTEMNHPQLFHLPSSLRRSRSNAGEGRTWQQEAREIKLHHLLGIAEADAKVLPALDHNEFTSSNKKAASLPDVVDEPKPHVNYGDTPPQLPELHLKASSVLLREEHYQDTESASSIQSGELSTPESSSTMNSQFEIQKKSPSNPQSVTQTTHHDVGNHKGEAQAVEYSSPRPSTTALQSSTRSPQSAPPVIDLKHPTRTWPHASNTSSKISAQPKDKTSGNSRPVGSTNPISNFPKPATGIPLRTSKPSRTSTFALENRLSGIEQYKKVKEALIHPMDPSFVKIHVRRPKAGVKHWFDGLDDDSSEEEDVHEPELQEACVGRLDSPFGDSTVKPLPETPSTITRRMKPALDKDSHSAKHSPVQPSQRPDSKEILSKPVANNTKVIAPLSSPKGLAAKRKSNPLNKFDLSQHSILFLSSSDDEDEGHSVSRAESAMSGPALRDSIVTDPMDADVEIGTAKTITAAGHRLTQLDLPRIKQLRHGEQPTGSGQPPAMFPPRRDSRMNSRMINQQTRSYYGSSISGSFGENNADVAPSQRTSIRTSFAPSEVGSFENWRLMNVTKQEETLLAAMRQKRASMHQVYTHDQRIDALRNLEKRQSRLSTASQHPDLTALHIDTTHLQPRAAYPIQRRLSDGDDRVHIRDSCTTFQTNGSRNDYRFSRATFQTDMSFEPGSRLSYISEPGGEIGTNPLIHSLLLDDRRISRASRASRDTYFSTSSAGYQAYRGLFTRNSHVVELDNLDKAPQRDEIPSQAFIDWPYNGWEARAALGMAH